MVESTVRVESELLREFILPTSGVWKKSYDQPKQHINKQRHYFTNKDLSSQNYGFSSSYVEMCGLNHKEG